MSNAIKQFFSSPAAQKKLHELVGNRASAFMTSVLQITQSNSMLKDADPATVFSAACVAATLDLPINNNLGFAYIVPYKNSKKVDGKWVTKIEAQFQLGYKGFIQLAQRSGQFKIISSAPVKEGQLVSADPLKGYEFDWNQGDSKKTIGYVAYFKLINGFEAYLYMTVDELKKHAGEYSQSYRYAQDNNKTKNSVWHEKFDAMATKTVIKLLLSKQAPLSIDTKLSMAVQADQAVIKDVDGQQTFEYTDNQEEPAKIEMDISNDDETFQTVLTGITNGQLDKAVVLSGEAGYVMSDEQTKQVVEA